MLTYPAVPRPCTVDCREVEEIYPREPKPLMEDIRLESIELKYPIDPRPCVVDCREPELMYPMLPRPCVVEVREAELM